MSSEAFQNASDIHLEITVVENAEAISENRCASVARI